MQFEEAFLELFENDADQVPGDDFAVPDGLFASVDDYLKDAILRERSGGIDDEELGSQAWIAPGRLFSA